MDRIAIIIPVHNRKNITLNCLKQLKNITKNGFETKIVVIDDGSTDGTSDIVSQKYPDAEVLKGDGSLWWSGGINKGFQYALEKGYDYVYTINDDIEIHPEALQFLYNTIKNNQNAVASSVLLKEGDKIYSAGNKFVGKIKKLKSQLKGFYKPSYSGMILEADCIASKSALLPIEIIKKVGYFDSKHFPHNYADFDYFLRIKKAGFSLLVNMDSRIYTKKSDTNFHNLIIHNNLKEIIKTFFNVKYGNHLRTLYNLALQREGMIFGHISFFYRLLPYLVWLTLKIILPKAYLRKVLTKSGRYEITNDER